MINRSGFRRNDRRNETCSWLCRWHFGDSSFLNVPAESREIRGTGRCLGRIFNFLRFSSSRTGLAIWFTVSIVASNYAFPRVEFLCGNHTVHLDQIRYVRLNQIHVPESGESPIVVQSTLFFIFRHRIPRLSVSFQFVTFSDFRIFN